MSETINSVIVSVSILCPCMYKAARILQSVDQTVDPCSDFFGFACGQWNREHPIPDELTKYDMFTMLNDALQDRLKSAFVASRVAVVNTLRFDLFHGLKMTSPWTLINTSYELYRFVMCCHPFLNSSSYTVNIYWRCLRRYFTLRSYGVDLLSVKWMTQLITQ